nr:Chain 1z, Oncocin d15-19 [Oncopeltus fasciatus]5HCQ_2z Chain 2z, Oncocin d15-19 [Oncopeltus fasciatus]
VDKPPYLPRPRPPR